MEWLLANADNATLDEPMEEDEVLSIFLISISLIYLPNLFFKYLSFISAMDFFLENMIKIIIIA